MPYVSDVHGGDGNVGGGNGDGDGNGDGNDKGVVVMVMGGASPAASPTVLELMRSASARRAPRNVNLCKVNARTRCPD